jgi:hypothetical protein
MPALHEPRPEHDRDRRSRELPQVLVDRWARLAMQRPWRYAATWAVSIGAANFGLRLLLSDLSLARNARLAALTAVGFFVFAWLYTAQLTRPLRRRGRGAHPAVPTTGGAAVWRGRPGRRYPTGRGPRSGSLWACPRHAEVSVKRTGGPAARSATWGRRLLLTAVAIAVVTVAVLVGTARAQASDRTPVRLDHHMTLAPAGTESAVARIAGVTTGRSADERCCKEVAVRSSSAVGIDGHQWSVQCAPGARLPCRAMCECGWTSTAGQRTRVLLELKGHLEETLKHGGGLSREEAGIQPWVERQEPGRLARRSQAGRGP